MLREPAFYLFLLYAAVGWWMFGWFRHRRYNKEDDSHYEMEVNLHLDA